MKLLSPKSFLEFTAEEYHTYIKSLYKRREKTAARKEQRDLKVRVKRKKDGTLSVITKRAPKYITEGELEKISKETGTAQSELFITLRGRGFHIYRDHREAESGAKRTVAISL